MSIPDWATARGGSQKERHRCYLAAGCLATLFGYFGGIDRLTPVRRRQAGGSSPGYGAAENVGGLSSTSSAWAGEARTRAVAGVNPPDC